MLPLLVFISANTASFIDAADAGGAAAVASGAGDFCTTCSLRYITHVFIKRVSSGCWAGIVLAPGLWVVETYNEVPLAGGIMQWGCPRMCLWVCDSVLTFFISWVDWYRPILMKLVIITAGPFIGGGAERKVRRRGNTCPPPLRRFAGTMHFGPPTLTPVDPNKA